MTSLVFRAEVIMVLDTSAVIAILLREEEGDLFIGEIDRDSVLLMSSVNVLETQMVIESRRGTHGGHAFDQFLDRAKIETVAFLSEHIAEARAAWRTYGKGNHPAALNFCDCAAYALSKITGEPLLFKGADFPRTDVIPVEFRTTERALPSMPLTLQPVYYKQGFFNVPLKYDHYFADHNEKIEISCPGLVGPIPATVNRTAQSSGTARVMGYVRLREYFKTHFLPGEEITVVIESPQRIRLERGRRPEVS